MSDAPEPVPDITPGDYPAARRALHELREALDTMTFPDPLRDGTVTALDPARTALAAVEATIRDHERMAIAASSFPWTLPAVLVRADGGQIEGLGVTDENGQTVPQREVPVTELTVTELADGRVTAERTVRTVRQDWTCLTEAAAALSRPDSQTGHDRSTGQRDRTAVTEGTAR